LFIFPVTLILNIRKIIFTTADEGSGNVDLFVKYNGRPDLDGFPFLKSTNNSNKEQISIDNPQTGDWYVMLPSTLPYENVRLNASLTPKNIDIKFLSINPDQFNVFSSSGISQFSIYSNTNWQISCNSSWITLLTNNGENNGDIEFMFDENLSTSMRTGIIDIIGVNVDTQKITVNQFGADPTLDVSSNLVTLDFYLGSTNEFNIYSNTSWTISGIPSWLEVNPINSSGNQKIKIKTSSTNPSSTSTREANLIISGFEVSKTVTIVQDPATVLPNLEVSTTNIQLNDSSGSTATFDVLSNISWTITYSDPWLNVYPISQTGDQTVSITATSDNPSTTSVREANLDISGAGISRIIKVIQGNVDVNKAPKYLEKDKIYRFYPNPTKGRIIVTLYDLSQIGNTIEVFNVYGKLVYSQKILSDLINLTLPALPEGVYLIGVRNNEISNYQKIILIK